MTWVDDQLFAAGGDHIPATWGEFADQTGVSAVVHLRPERPAAFLGPPPRAFLWLAVADEAEADLETRWLAARFVFDRVLRGESVLLHSSLGRHRTRWVYVAYSLMAGRRLETALRRAAEPPWLAPYPTDRDRWRAFADLVRARREQLAAPGAA